MFKEMLVHISIVLFDQNSKESKGSCNRQMSGVSSFKDSRRQLTMLKVLVPSLKKGGNADGDVRSEDEEMTAEGMLEGEVA